MEVKFGLLALPWSLEKKKKGYVQLVVMGLRMAVCVFFGAYDCSPVAVGP